MRSVKTLAREKGISRLKPTAKVFRDVNVGKDGRIGDDGISGEALPCGRIRVKRSLEGARHDLEHLWSASDANRQKRALTSKTILVFLAMSPFVRLSKPGMRPGSGET